MDDQSLIAGVEQLHSAIRQPRDDTLHDLCWHHPKLWGPAARKSDPQPTVPGWPKFRRVCICSRQSLDELSDAPRDAAGSWQRRFVGPRFSRRRNNQRGRSTLDVNPVISRFWNCALSTLDGTSSKARNKNFSIKPPCAGQTGAVQ
jgi:hypothetical protein